MMKKRLLPVFSLLAVLLAACAPGSTATNAPIPTEPPGATAPTLTLAAPTSQPATQPTSGEATALPVATSRGPNLEATDPATVSLASGGLQFVEFFRFT